MTDIASDKDKATDNGGPIRELGQVRSAPGADGEPADVTPVDEVRNLGREEAPGSVPAVGRDGGTEEPGKGDWRFEWKSLKEHHLKLAREGYVPPKPKEVPLKIRRQKAGKPVLRDIDVMFARKNTQTYTCLELAEMFGVSHITMYRAIKGYTYCHLNFLVRPQR